MGRDLGKVTQILMGGDLGKKTERSGGKKDSIPKILSEIYY